MDKLVCKKCKKEKDFFCFKIEKRTKLGYDTTCLQCRSSRISELRKLNPEKYRQKDAKNRQKKSYKEYQAKYAKLNKGRLKEQNKIKYYKNREPYLLRSKKQKQRLGEKYKEYQKQYRYKNKEKLRVYAQQRYQTNLNRRLRNCISGAIHKMLHGKIKKSKTLVYLGCDLTFFKEYIKAKFKNNMTWENHGKLWQLDHIIPCRFFDFNKEDNLYKCFHYSNYQPLFSLENNLKSDILPSGIRARNLK